MLITGGATGIGATLVEEFVAQGARVGFIDIDTASGEALVARLPEARHAPAFVAADLTDIDALDARDRRAARSAPARITVLLNNAANDQRHSIDDDDLRRAGMPASRSTSSTSSSRRRTSPPT